MCMRNGTGEEGSVHVKWDGGGGVCACKMIRGRRDEFMCVSCIGGERLVTVRGGEGSLAGVDGGEEILAEVGKVWRAGVGGGEKTLAGVGGGEESLEGGVWWRVGEENELFVAGVWGKKKKKKFAVRARGRENKLFVVVGGRGNKKENICGGGSWKIK